MQEKDPCQCCEFLYALLIGLTFHFVGTVVLVAILFFTLPAYEQAKAKEFQERLTELLGPED